MSSSSPLEALRFIVDVRWQLLESFALARQEGLVEPVGLVIDSSFPYGRAAGEKLLLSGAPISGSGRRATCLPRASLCGALHGAAPDLLPALREGNDEPGHFTVVVLAEEGLVVTGTWQDLITGSASKSSEKSRHIRLIKP
jgi:hypothetical protein